MAYNRGAYNPDALPAHAEPEQAAQMLGQNKPSGSPQPPRQSPNSNARPPPAQQQPPPQQQGQSYGRPPPNNQGYQQQPPPNQSYQQQQPPPNQGYQHQQQQPPPNQGYQNQGGYQSQQGGYQQSQGYNDYNRNPSPRYGQQQAPPPQQSYGQPQGQPGRNPLASPPPPGNAPPPTNYHGRPTIPEHQRPPTVAPPRDANDRDALWPLFLQVDKDRSGQLTENELQRALVNGDYTAFDPHTVRMMIRMFDTDRSGTINFDEFCGLWGFLAAWRGLFDRFDTDRSGSISLREFEDALVAFGYRLSPQFVSLLFNTYAKNHSRGRGDDGDRQKVLSFDLFVQACISLKRMTDVFKKFDTDRDGYITLSFEEFLTGAQGLFLFNSVSPRTDTGLY